jgi:hypothetical protein
MVTDPRARPYRVWLYRRYREVRLDGRSHLVWLNLRTDDDREQQANQERLHALYEQLVAADDGSRWDKEQSQLLLTADVDETTRDTAVGSFWWAPDLKERR